ncbi:IS21 family transposase [Vallitalea guaymasensis]|uniref:IS21 family transposase n=1 Tax=Vallitalea guaymasensis TaxID=1185412 RepID=UPI000DE44300|nr:IS21 family transposase [Vallitalea guaymasensis]
MQISINYGLINSIEDLRLFSNVYKKGLLMKPNISRLARTLKADRKTIRKALNGFVPSKTKTRSKYLDKYRDTLVTLLNDEYREFEYYKHLFNYMVRENNITCSYSCFRRYIKNDTELNKLFKNSKPTNTFSQRFETKAGVQAQFDLKERVPIVDKMGNKIKINVATLTLGFSRLNIRKIVPDTSYEVVVSFLASAFEELGGVPKELVIDNIKCLVNTPRKRGKQATLNSKFIEFSKDYNIEILPCMPYRPQTKGKTETQNKVPSQLKNYNGTYNDLDEVHEKLRVINCEDNETISQGTNFPAVFLFKHEKDKLQKLPRKDIRKNYYLKTKEVVVSNESLISYKSNKYSVPKQYIGKIVGRIIKNNKLHIYYNNSSNF